MDGSLMAKAYDAIVGRVVEEGETQGFMKIIMDAQTHEILGAAILGTGGDEAIHSILDVMYARAPYTVMQGPCTFTRPSRTSSPQCSANSSRYQTEAALRSSA
jgi:pyruvate/2-oxoglutarate dehydrogenase complex dihydrolipoamide dehydrogenase (E3) component